MAEFSMMKAAHPQGQAMARLPGQCHFETIEFTNFLTHAGLENAHGQKTEDRRQKTEDRFLTSDF